MILKLAIRLMNHIRDVNPTRSTSNEYTVIAGVCTHLGVCSPKYYPEMESQPWDESWVGGFFCPCHGSTFDIVGRVFKGVPAPTNLKVPPHIISDGNILTIGEDKRHCIMTQINHQAFFNWINDSFTYCKYI